MVEGLEGRRMLAASPRASSAPEAVETTVDLAVGQQFTGEVASLTGVDTSRFADHPSRMPKAVIRWGDGSRTRVAAAVGSPDRLVAVVPEAKSHAYAEPGTFGVVVTFRRGERVFGRVTEFFRVSYTSPDGGTTPPPVGQPPPRPGGNPDPRRYEHQIKDYEAHDRERMPPSGGVLFVGSSSIRHWTTLAKDFPGVPVINRGFGGAQIPDVVYFASRIVLPYKPKTIVFYCGENDLGEGSSPLRVLADFKAFEQAVHAKLPTTRILFISVKPSPILWKIADKLRETNRLVRDFTQTDTDRLGYIDVFSPMLGGDGKPRTELFLDDGQHLNPQGYALWTELVAKRL
jgi:lysophospholipase L1-like esterase